MTVLLRCNLVYDRSGTDFPLETSVNTFYLQGVGPDRSGVAGDWPDLQTMTDALSAPVLTNWTNTKSSWAPGIRLARLDVYEVSQASDLALSKGAHVFNSLGGGTYAAPAQISAVLSLFGYTPGAFVAEAPRKRGRVFLGPLAQSALANTGKLDNGFITGQQNSWAAMFRSIAALPATAGYTFRPIIWSRAGRFMTPIVGVRVDDRVDIQRRRARTVATTKTYVAL